MKIVSVRSPYTIIIAESGQIGSKVELYIWYKGQSVPTTANYTLSKLIPSPTQIDTFYNVSNYVKEFISQDLYPEVNAPVTSDNQHWVNFRVKRFKLVGSTYTELDSTDYVGVNGYNDPLEGYNKIVNNTHFLCGSTAIKLQYNSIIPFYNFICERNATDNFNVKYYDKNGSLLSTNIFLTAGSTEIYNFCIPVVAADETVTAKICRGTTVLYTITSQEIEEYKYEFNIIAFINKKGGWQTLFFFKKSSESISVKSTEAKLNTSNPNYTVEAGQTRFYNFQGTKTIKLNTGWVDENYSELITELLFSEKILLNSTIPVKLKNKSFDLKTSINDKMINYEVEFELDYNLINDVI